MLITHGNLGRIFTGVKATFQRGFELADPKWGQIAMEVPSNTEKEDYPWLGVAQRMREWVDERHIQSMGTHQFQIVNRDWELTHGLERNKIADDTFGIFQPLFLNMGMTVRLHPDELIFGLMNTGAAAGSLGYDGVPFYSAIHPNEFTGVQTNEHTDGAGLFWYLADLSSPIRPFIYQRRQNPVFVSKQSLTDDEVFFRKRFLFGADARYEGGYGLWQQTWRSNRTLNDTNLEAAWLGMTTRLADNGLPMRFSPTHLVVPETLRFDALRLLDRELIIDVGATGATNNIHRNSLQLITTTFLTA